MKIKIEGFVMRPPFSEIPLFTFSDMSKYGYTMIGPVSLEIDYEVPADWNPVSAEIDMINKKLDAMADDYHASKKQLENRIAELSCIDNVPMFLQEQAA